MCRHWSEVQESIKQKKPIKFCLLYGWVFVVSNSFKKKKKIILQCWVIKNILMILIPKVLKQYQGKPLRSKLPDFTKLLLISYLLSPNKFPFLIAGESASATQYVYYSLFVTDFWLRSWVWSVWCTLVIVYQ